MPEKFDFVKLGPNIPAQSLQLIYFGKIWTRYTWRQTVSVMDLCVLSDQWTRVEGVSCYITVSERSLE